MGELLESGRLDHALVPNNYRIEAKGSKGKKKTKKQEETEEMYKSIENDMTDLGDKGGNQETYSTSIVAVGRNDDENEKNKSILTNYRYPRGANHAALVLPDAATTEEQAAPTQNVQEKLTITDFNEWKASMPKDNEDQISKYFLEDNEVQRKEVVFNRMHQNYLDDLERRRAEATKAAGNDGEDGEAQPSAKRFRRGRNPAAIERDPNETTEDALQARLASKRISRKINYEAMSALFDEEGAFSTKDLEDVPTKKEEIVDEFVEDDAVFDV